MTPAGIETTTFRFVTQHLNHCATAVPSYYIVHAYFEFSNSTLYSLRIFWVLKLHHISFIYILMSQTSQYIVHIYIYCGISNFTVYNSRIFWVLCILMSQTSQYIVHIYIVESQTSQYIIHVYFEFSNSTIYRSYIFWCLILHSI